MEKGQVFSLDFLISLVAVVAAVGLMLQAVEVNTYAQKEERMYNEMKMAAETAADLITLGNDTTCQNAAGTRSYANCVDLTLSNNWENKVPDMFRQGACAACNPNGYKYEIELSGTTETVPGGFRWVNEDFYEVRRTVATSIGGAPETLRVKVWK
jgi:hypothetical protein